MSWEVNSLPSFFPILLSSLPSFLPSLISSPLASSQIVVWKGALDAPIHTIGEGNGISLQYSCLDNPMDGGAS